VECHHLVLESSADFAFKRSQQPLSLSLLWRRVHGIDQGFLDAERSHNRVFNCCATSNFLQTIRRLMKSPRWATALGSSILLLVAALV
jgi:hypothetical protein